MDDQTFSTLTSVSVDVTGASLLVFPTTATTTTATTNAVAAAVEDEAVTQALRSSSCITFTKALAIPPIQDDEEMGEEVDEDEDSEEWICATSENDDSGCSVDSNRELGSGEEDMDRCSNPVNGVACSNVQPPSACGAESAAAADRVCRILRKSWDSASKTFTYRNHHWEIQELWQYALALINQAEAIFASQPLLLKLPANTFIIGDLHGNFSDLLYFTSLHSSAASGSDYNYVFLGDYVDRGEHSVEVILYLLACKCQWPKHICLLRGNHEDPSVNGDLSRYGKGSFLAQCKEVFGQELGQALWERINQGIFARLPLTAIVAEKFYCCHGGFPRSYELNPLLSERFPRFYTLAETTPTSASFTPSHGTRLSKEVVKKCQVAVHDILWADPIPESPTATAAEFGVNTVRGGNVLGYNKPAVRQLLQRYGFQALFRGHDVVSGGVEATMSGLVTTVFSSSGYERGQNRGGAVLIRQNNGTEVVETFWKAADAFKGGGAG